MLVMNFLSRSGYDTQPTVGLTWYTLHRAIRTLDKGLAEQSSLKNGRPSLLPSIRQQTVHTRPVYDWSARNIKCASPDNHHRKAWSSLIVQSIRVSSSRPSHGQPSLLPRTKEITEHAYRVGTAGRVYLVHPQLEGTKRHLTETCCSCHCCTVGVRRQDHVLEKLIWTRRRPDLQSDGDMHPVPNYPR